MEPCRPRRAGGTIGAELAKRIDDAVGAAAVETARSLGERSDAAGAAARAEREGLATAVRWTLQRLAERAPGHTVEVRVPPFGAVQVVEGPRHTRGTPPNVVETDPRTWLALAAGDLAFSTALAEGRVQASGTRTDLSPYLPLA